jgi:hypothetical protein
VAGSDPATRTGTGPGRTAAAQGDADLRNLHPGPGRSTRLALVNDCSGRPMEKGRQAWRTRHFW